MNPDGLKETLKALFGPYYKPVRDYLFGPAYSLVASLWDPTQNLFIGYLLSSAFLALLVFWTQAPPDARFSIRKFLSYLAPKQIFLHKSAILDYKFWLINSYVTRFLLSGLMLGSATLLSGPVKSGMTSIFGEGPAWAPSMTARAAYTAFVVLAFDLGGYIGHYLEHRVPLFWQFHKTHHSCEVLTPISTFRNHPMDEIVEGITMAVTGGLMVGVFSYLYPAGVTEFTVINVGVISLLFYLTANLLHSHIWLSYGWRLNHVFMAPCMHQIHHSSQKRHFDCNFGPIFSVWDHLFGTIYVPKGKEEITLGISNDEHKDFNSVWSLYFLPFKKAVALFQKNDVAPGATSMELERPDQS